MLDSIYSNENFKNCRYLFRINGVLFIIFIIYNFSFTEIKTSSDMFSMYFICQNIKKKRKKKGKFEMNNKMHRHIVVLLIKYENNILVFSIDTE